MAYEYRIKDHMEWTASGIVVDFTKAVNFTVTAEDASTEC